MSTARRHEHVFLGAAHGENERRTWIVIALCAAMMGDGKVGDLAGFTSAIVLAMIALLIGWELRFLPKRAEPLPRGFPPDDRGGDGGRVSSALRRTPERDHIVDATRLYGPLGRGNGWQPWPVMRPPPIDGRP